MNITILAVTRKLNGICIAGVNEDLKWIRPTINKPFNPEDLKLDNGKYVSISNIYAFEFIKHAPEPPQTENYLVDKSKVIKHIKKLNEDERLDLFENLSENIGSNAMDITTYLKRNNRSLIMLGPVKIVSVHIEEKNDKKPRIICTLGSSYIRNQIGKTALRCTDLKFRALAKRLLKEKKLNALTGEKLQDILGFEKVFVTIGLTQPFQPPGHNKEDYWPMIIGFHTVPDYKQEIDYDDL